MFGMELCYKKNMSSTAVGKVMESVHAMAQEMSSDAGDRGRESVGRWLAE